ncbi:MAG: class IV adenylate cyclase [Streptosporangiaceae bacterium]
MIEAELKARVADPGALHPRLGELAAAERAVYRDAYYDDPAGTISGTGRELRLRTIIDDSGAWSLLTYKEAAVEAASGSKPEHESRIGDPAAVDLVLRGLGLAPWVAFEKHCTNYRFTARGRSMLATVVAIPGIDGSFIEVETMTDQEGVAAALADIRDVMGQLQIAGADLTSEKYTDAVLRAEHERSSAG